MSMPQMHPQPSIPNKPSAGVTFVLLRPSGDILMQQRGEDPARQIPYPNTWCIPGGALEPGEEYLETAVREIEEEYDLRVRPEQCELLLIYDHDNMVDDHVYLCRVPQDVKPILREGRDMQWKTIEEIKQLALGWEQAKIIDRIEQHV